MRSRDLFPEQLSRRILRDLLLGGCFVTTPTSLLKRLTGQEACTDLMNLSGGATVGTAGLTLADGTVIGTSATGPIVAVPAATTTLTVTAALHAGRTIAVASTGGLAVTPPAATGTGNKYRFACTAAISGGNFTIDAKAGNASDVFTGWVQSYKATTFTPYVTASNSNLLTFNGTTTGGAAAGDWIEIIDIATNKWLITGYTIQSGTIATMFSNH